MISKFILERMRTRWIRKLYIKLYNKIIPRRYLYYKALTNEEKRKFCNETLAGVEVKPIILNYSEHKTKLKFKNQLEKDVFDYMMEGRFKK